MANRKVKKRNRRRKNDLENTREWDAAEKHYWRCLKKLLKFFNAL